MIVVSITSRQPKSVRADSTTIASRVRGADKVLCPLSRVPARQSLGDQVVDSAPVKARASLPLHLLLTLSVTGAQCVVAHFLLLLNVNVQPSPLGVLRSHPPSPIIPRIVNRLGQSEANSSPLSLLLPPQRMNGEVCLVAIVLTLPLPREIPMKSMIGAPDLGVLYHKLVRLVGAVSAEVMTFCL